MNVLLVVTGVMTRDSQVPPFLYIYKFYFFPYTIYPFFPVTTVIIKRNNKEKGNKYKGFSGVTGTMTGTPILALL